MSTSLILYISIAVGLAVFITILGFIIKKFYDKRSNRVIEVESVDIGEYSKDKISMSEEETIEVKPIQQQ